LTDFLARARDLADTAVGSTGRWRRMTEHSDMEILAYNKHKSATFFTLRGKFATHEPREQQKP
jgi:hypothetical protein